ncbi:uncharacterized protein A1O9_00956 [Exophiala aquamarina CBS 119918]|uniref:FAS1 domain-containing protein n=1 Tax=Exophiala aquamarina CBS 119918 TaxID=1182545 RepID=A0A072PSX6_9EURO|nr:uncharacterized protein A1O9_00956 [Exophiala aquamarina CBS 119918]KEF62981.1 hypothetical protein A1O9_00956 [Exophiala aquamarina CBS 119918]
MLFRLAGVTLCIALVTAQDLTLFEALKAHAELSNLTYLLTRSQDFVSWLDSLENITLLAPDNNAIENLTGSTDITSVEVDEDGTQALLKYHILNGTYSSFGTSEYRSIPSLLQPSDYSNVTGGQIVVAQGSSITNISRFISGLLHRSSTIGDPIEFKSGMIHVIDTTLTLPQAFTDTAEDRLFLAAEAFAKAEIAAPSSEAPQTLDELSDVTVFLPMNHSIREIGNLIEKMSRAELDRVVAYHTIDQRLVINLEEPPNGTYMTLEGSEVSIFPSNGHAFINSARIVGSPDWLFTGGAIYIIDGALNPDNRTVDRNIQDAEIAYTGASFTQDFDFPSAVDSELPSSSGTGTGTNSSGANSAKSTSSGLSKAAKIGISVAAAIVGLVLLGALLAFLFTRRRRARKNGRLEYPMSELTPSQKDLTSNAAVPGSDRY